MDWTAPYLVASLAVFAGVETWFVVAMIRIGRRYHAVVRHELGPGDQAQHPGGGRRELSPEDLGLLVDEEERWTEVALLRLCLEGHLVEDGLIVLVDDPGESAAAGEPKEARDAILERLRGRRPAHLLAVLYAGSKHGDSSAAYRRLADHGLVDAGAVPLARTRRRVLGAYVTLTAVTLVAAVICMVLAAPGPLPAALGGVTLFVASTIVAEVTSRLSGARFEVITPAGRELLRTAGRLTPDSPDDRLLHRVALRGLAIIPEFAAAADRGNPDAGQTTGQQGYNAVSGLLGAVLGLFPGGGSTGDSKR